MASEMQTTIVLQGKLSPSVTKAFGQAQKQVSRTQAVMNKMGGAAMKALKVGVTAAAAAGAAAITYAVKEAAAYETSLAKVSTIADAGK